MRPLDSSVHAHLERCISRFWQGLLVIEDGAVICKGFVTLLDNSNANGLRLEAAEAVFYDRGHVPRGIGKQTFCANRIEFHEAHALMRSAKENALARLYYTDLVCRVDPNLIDKIGNGHIERTLQGGA